MKANVEILTNRKLIYVTPAIIAGAADRILVDVCVKCGAVVFDVVRHDIWHRAAGETGEDDE